MVRNFAKFVNQIQNEETPATGYSCGVVTRVADRYCVGYEMQGANETFSIGQPVYDSDLNLMGYLGVGFYECLNYACDIRIPVETWEICLPTKDCVAGKKIFSYWQMLEMKGEENV